MVDLSLPFYILIDARGELAPCAFSTAQTVTDFLNAEALGRWKITVIGGCDDLILAIADVHQQGARIVWLDPPTRAEPGVYVQLLAFAELHERLKRSA